MAEYSAIRVVPQSVFVTFVSLNQEIKVLFAFLAGQNKNIPDRKVDLGGKHDFKRF